MATTIGHIPRYRPLYLRSLALLAQWEGNLEQAIIYLEEAYTLAETIGLPGEQWQILVKLRELYRSQGHEARARQAFGKAQEIVQALSAHIDDESLRVGFLTAEVVRRLLDEAT